MRHDWKNPSTFTLWFALVATVFVPARVLSDWSTYLHDAARSGITAESVALPAAEDWSFRPHLSPLPAWDVPKPVPVEKLLELPRNRFDDAFHVAVGEGCVYFASSANGRVYCLDEATGGVRWTKASGAPVRLAPMLAGGKVYFGNDGGIAFCLDAKTGEELWRFQAAPENRRLLGNGRMISLWPLRSGVLVDDGVAYFTAGLFPNERVFLYAVDAQTGSLLWKNDTKGEAAFEQISFSPQGYLLASKNHLYTPLGRVPPAAFDRATGAFKYYTAFGKTVGGTYALLVDDKVYTGTSEIVGFDQNTRDRFASFPGGRRMVVDEKTAYLLTPVALFALDRAAKDVKEPKWRAESPGDASMILAGKTLFVGGKDKVTAIDVHDGKAVWSAEIAGTAKGLAASGGRLFVSTDSGTIHAFSAEAGASGAEVAEEVVENPYPETPDGAGAPCAQTARKILDAAGPKGYALVSDLEDGRLAHELARQSEMIVYAVSDDAETVRRIRETLDKSPLLDSRLYVECHPVEAIPYSDYFANVVVSEKGDFGTRESVPDHLYRMLKPQGGVLVLAKSEGGVTAHVRGALPGSGNWTHQYADAANTTCGDDTRVKAPFSILWFGNPGPKDMPNRHQRAAAPLSLDGRLFIEGENTLMAYDAYNGVKLWQREIPGAIRLGVFYESGNMAIDPSGFYVGVQDHCLRLDPATGETMETYFLPAKEESDESLGGKDERWGYVAYVDGLLYGTRSHDRRTTSEVFAFDAKTKELAWRYRGKGIPQSTLCIGGGILFLLDGNVEDSQRQAYLEARRAEIPSLEEPLQEAARKHLAQADVRSLVALDAKTGKRIWARTVDVHGTGGGPDKYAGSIATMFNNDVLVLFGIYLDGHYWKEFFAGTFDHRAITAFDAKTGGVLWSKPVGFRVRPLIVGDTLHAEPWAFDLRTGEPKTRVHPVTGQVDQWQFARPGHHCGCPAANEHCLFFRSWYLGYYDLLRDAGTYHFAAHRPGCWISFIPAAGLLLAPEADTGCLCVFPNACTVVYQPADEDKIWSMFSAPGPMTPVARLGLNFGVAGDRKDENGDWWLGYPRPGGSLVLQFGLDHAFYPGGRFEQENSVYADFPGDGPRWLFASAAVGLKEFRIPLVGEGDGKAVYTVKLGFRDPLHAEPGKRVFHIRLQGLPVAENFDIAAAAVEPGAVVWKTFSSIEVDGALNVEFIAADGKPAEHQMPLLHAVEITREKVLELGCLVGDAVISDADPRKTCTVTLKNLREEPFEGTLVVEAPEGFSVDAPTANLRLAPGECAERAIAISVPKGVEPKMYAMPVKLVDKEGNVLLERSASVEHLGPLTRLVLSPVADAHASRRYPLRNQGGVGTVLVDGGAAAMEDEAHSQAFLRYEWEPLAGKVVRATFEMTNGDNPTSDAGKLRLVTGPWNETQITYENRPKLGATLLKLGPFGRNETKTFPLDEDISGKTLLDLAVDPTSCDGYHIGSRESSAAPRLIIEYVRK